MPSLRDSGPRILPAIALTLMLSCVATMAEASTTTVTTEPPSPTSGTPVTIVVFNSCDCPHFGPPPVRTGSTFDFPYGPLCFSVCVPVTTRHYVGLLEPGAYTVQQVLEGNPSTAQPIGAFVVSEGLAPTIPTLGIGGTISLVVLLSLAALRRFSVSGRKRAARS